MSNKNRGSNRPETEVKPAAPAAPAAPEVKDVVEGTDVAADTPEATDKPADDSIESNVETGDDTQDGATGTDTVESGEGSDITDEVKADAPDEPVDESKPEEGAGDTAVIPVAAEVITAPETAVVEPETAAVVVDETAPAVSFAAAEEAPLTNDEAVTKFFNQLIDVYAENMAPGRPVTPDQGKFYQRSLLRIYQAVLAREEGEFAPAMHALLNAFHQHRAGVFSLEYVFRFKEAAALEASMGRFFERFTSLCIRVSNPETRQLTIAQEVNHSSVLDTISNEDHRNRLQGFLLSYVN